MAFETLTLIGAIAYLGYLFFNFRHRAIGTTKRKDSHFVDLPGWPLVGNLPEILFDLERPLESFTLNNLKFGPGYSITLPGIRFIDISKPEWIEHVQKTNFNNYVKGPLIHSLVEDLIGNSIFSIDGTLWKQSRQVVTTLFSVHAFKTMIVPRTNKSTDELIQTLEDASKEGRNLDLSHLAYCFALESIVRMTFGKDLGLLGRGFKEKKDVQPCLTENSVFPSFSSAFDFTSEHVDFRLTRIFAWRLFETLNFRRGQKMKAACRMLDDYIYPIIDERMSQRSGAKFLDDQDGLQDDFLRLLMTALDERGTLDRKFLRDTIMSILIAGRDTTAQNIEWSFFHLLMNPDIVSKIRNETSEILGDDANGEERVTFDNYKSFTWSYCVVLEALRLHPSVPKNLRFAVAADKIPGGPTIEPGDCVRWCDWQMGRDPEIWGADCGEFKPSRWIDRNGSVKQFGYFKFHAFNGGPRLCLGMNLAMFEVVKVIVEVFRKFELKFADGWLERVPKSESLEGIHSDYSTPKYRASITLPMKEPMIVSISPRREASSS